MILDENNNVSSSAPKASANNIILSVNNPEASNLTNQILQSPAVLRNDEEEMKKVLEKQAEINSKIANLLILIRRFRDSKSENEIKAAQVAQDLQNLIPS